MPKPRAAVFLRNQSGEPASLAQGLDEFFRVGVFLVATAPVLIAEARAQRSHGRADFLLAIGQFEIHLSAPWTAGSSAPRRINRDGRHAADRLASTFPAHESAGHEDTIKSVVSPVIRLSSLPISPVRLALFVEGRDTLEPVLAADEYVVRSDIQCIGSARIAVHATVTATLAARTAIGALPTISSATCCAILQRAAGGHYAIDQPPGVRLIRLDRPSGVRSSRWRGERRYCEQGDGSRRRPA